MLCRSQRREHGIAVARANNLPGASTPARVIAEHLVREVVGTGVASRVHLQTTLLAVWAWYGRKRFLRMA